MIREDRFLISHRPYAVDLSSLRINGHWARVDAVWFRGTKSAPTAHIGFLHTIQDPDPIDATEFLCRYSDGRYGGNCLGRWDGERYWGEQVLDIMNQHPAILRPMLDNYPAAPDGYDGWWRF